MATLDQLKQAITDLQAAVAAEKTVADSAVLLLTNLNQMLKDALANAGTPQDVVDSVAAITAQIDAEKQALADAVTANTPATPQP